MYDTYVAILYFLIISDNVHIQAIISSVTLAVYNVANKLTTNTWDNTIQKAYNYRLSFLITLVSLHM